MEATPPPLDKNRPTTRLFVLSVALYVLIIAIINIFMSKRWLPYPWGSTTVNGWDWYRHWWSGWGGPWWLIIMAVVLFALISTYLIRRRIPAYLWIIICGLIGIVLIQYVYNWHVMAHAIQYAGNTSLYSLARSQSGQQGVLDFIRHYLEALEKNQSENYSGGLLLSSIGTHPPGGVVFYMWLENLAHWAGPKILLPNTEPMIVLFVKFIVGALNLIPLYLLGKKLAGRVVGYYVVLFMAVSAGLAMFSIYPETVNIGFLIWSFYWLVLAEKRPGFIYLSAILAAISTFFNFGHFFFYAIFFIWMLIRRWQREIAWRQVIRWLLIYLLIGFLWIIFVRYYLNYDYLIGWRISSAAHYEMTGTRKLSVWWSYNILDTWIFAGWPVVILALAAIPQAIKRMGTTLENALVILAPVSLLVLDLTGMTRGETGRIWFFMDMLFWLVAAIYLKWLGVKRGAIVFTLAIILSVITLLTIRGSIYTIFPVPGYLGVVREWYGGK